MDSREGCQRTESFVRCRCLGYFLGARMGRSYFRSGFSVLVAAVLAAGCSTTRTTSGGAVGVDREQTMLVSSAEVNRSAEKAYLQTLHDEQAKNHLNRDAAELQRVRRIAGRLIPVTAAFRTDAPGWRWEVNVIS